MIILEYTHYQSRACVRKEKEDWYAGMAYRTKQKAILSAGMSHGGICWLERLCSRPDQWEYLCEPKPDYYWHLAF
jgi:hypothetical protein